VNSETTQPPAVQAVAPRKPQRSKRRVVNKGGRPTEYRPGYAHQAYKFALARFTDTDIAGFFDVSLTTFSAWQDRYPPLASALRRGREEAVADVAVAVKKSAVGFKHRAMHIAVTSYEGTPTVTKVPYTEKYPPNVAAAKLFLTNHAPDQWKERTEATLQGPGGAALPPAILCVGLNDLPLAKGDPRAASPQAHPDVAVEAQVEPQPQITAPPAPQGGATTPEAASAANIPPASLADALPVAAGAVGRSAEPAQPPKTGRFAALGAAVGDVKR
jgi:hypothetical protein